MYMNISDFRKDLKKHFDDAIQGRPVFITRAGQMFKLEAFVPKKPDDNIITIPFTKLSTDKVSSNIRPDIKNIRLAQPTKQCPHGYAQGMCKKADCNRKYK